MCEHGDTKPMLLIGGVADVDSCIVPLVRALDDAGIRTIASCCGHGHRPGSIAIEDGRELLIARNFNEARALTAGFPDIHGNPTTGTSHGS